MYESAKFVNSHWFLFVLPPFALSFLCFLSLATTLLDACKTPAVFSRADDFVFSPLFRIFLFVPKLTMLVSEMHASDHSSGSSAYVACVEGLGWGFQHQAHTAWIRSIENVWGCTGMQWDLERDDIQQEVVAQISGHEIHLTICRRQRKKEKEGEMSEGYSEGGDL